MKKKKLKLNLKKDVISNLQAKNIKGGEMLQAGTVWFVPTECALASDNGCTGTIDETMTCANWSCGC